MHLLLVKSVGIAWHESARKGIQGSQGTQRKLAELADPLVWPMDLAAPPSATSEGSS